MIDLTGLIRDVPDFPKPGIIFKDITPLLADPGAMTQTVKQLAEPFADAGIDVVTGIESRGFIFGALVAAELGVAFVPIRKPGKLPYETIGVSYELEYGTDTVEVHCDAIKPGQKILMVDDLLATGGTMAAACELIEKIGGQVAGIAFVIELAFLNGKAKLDKYTVHSLMEVTGE